jgi:hypothetical protein
MLDTVDVRVIVGAVWGVGVMLTFGRVLAMRLHSFRLHRDSRSRRDLIEAGALFTNAVAAALATFTLLNTSVSDWRAFFTAVAVGNFLALGIYMATERPHDPADDDSR